MGEEQGQGVALVRGANISLRDEDAELEALTLVLDAQDSASSDPIEADVSVLLVGEDGRVRGNEDFVFYNQRAAYDGAVQLREKLRSVDPPTTSDFITVALDELPDHVTRVVVVGSTDPGAASFAESPMIQVRIQRSNGDALGHFRISELTTERALIFGEFYRRRGDWRFRAVGQGYSDGLEAVARAFGVEVATDTPAETSDAQRSEVPEPVKAKSVSVQRDRRPPKMPAAWRKTLPEGTADLRPARLFPTAGIGGSAEREQRATSILLSVSSVVRDFGLSWLRPCGAPTGPITAYVEVPFGHDELPYRPDGLVEVTRGKRTWRALVEVKTGTNDLEDEQVSTYVEIARAQSFDAVITISNQLPGPEGVHPVMVDKRKLRKVDLFHVSWDELRMSAALLQHRGAVSDPTQRLVLEEFERYLDSERAGLRGFEDMGKFWPATRDAVRSGTARPNDRGVIEVCDRFDQAVRKAAIELSCLLGVEVQSARPRDMQDQTSRRQQLTDSAKLFGALRVPGALESMYVGADLRVERVACSMTIPAPREGRQLTRVNWLLRQLVDARDGIRVETVLAGSRRDSTAALLKSARAEPTTLVPAGDGDIRGFIVTLEMPMGAKRSVGTGGLVTSIGDVTKWFYDEVGQNVRAWSARPPKMPD
ncbi:TerD family protein [Calidifontibacter sp. DB0510]|uniref:TerD family protein n=1 Tax=Metallococcus carri TaxID=1656884 RepID=A0A967B3B2_9MICO|nr:TerD family protein [Metallococcus carri]NHN57204.1 TerD family protein [Metallococcus carri]NOP37993.1 TerD family protein [Calidifontibacter sp. DB2511S]